MIPVTYGYARVSKTDAARRNLETQLHIIQEFGLRKDRIFTDEHDQQLHVPPILNQSQGEMRI